MTDMMSGTLWLVIDVILVLALGGALAYGTMAWRKRSRDPVVEQVRDNATREMYNSPEK